MDTSSRNALIEAHLPFAYKLATKFCAYHKIEQDAEDVRSAAVVALCIAASRFDPEQGNAFATFAYYHIDGAIKDSAKRAIKAQRVAEACAAEPFESQGLNFYVVTDLDTGQRHVEASYAVKQSPEDSCFAKEVRRAVRRLPRRDRRLLAQHFYSGLSCLEIGVATGYHKCHVRRLLNQAVEKLGQRLRLTTSP